MKKDFDYRTTIADLDKLSKLARSDCPRRYCWFWGSHSFEWNVGPKEGCVFLKMNAPDSVPGNNTPCKRAESDSRIDHYEPYDPKLDEDGVDGSKYLV